MSHDANAQDAYFRYRTGLTISLGVVLVQIAVLFFTGRAVFIDWSIGLFEDTMHGIADNLILIGATIVLYFETQGALPNKGRKRILALIGGVLLIGAGVGGIFVAGERILGAQMPVAGWSLVATSLIAVVGGWFAFRVIHGVHESQHDHLHHSAVAHLLGDLAISLTVLFSALGIIYFNLPAIDSYVTLILIAPWMIFRGFQVLKYRDPHESGDSMHHDGGHHHH